MAKRAPTSPASTSPLAHSSEMAARNEGVLGPALRIFADDLHVSAQAGRFGGISLRLGETMFAMAVQGQLAVKLPVDVADDLVARHRGERLVLGARAMKQWIVVDLDSDAGVTALRHARAYAAARSLPDTA